MKKLGILMMPLMAVSLLASCGNNNKKPIDLLTRIDMDVNGNKYQTFYTYNKSYRVTKIEEIRYDRQSGEANSVTTDTFAYKGSKIDYSEHSWVVNGKEETASTTTYTYDSKGNLIQTEEIGTNSEGEYKDKYNFKYNKQKLLISYKRYHAENADYELSEQHTYEYNDHKDVIKDVEIDYVHVDETGVTTYTYDEYYCCIHDETIYEEEGKENTYTDTTYYKNHPDKPLHRKFVELSEPRTVETDYTYDELDRLKCIDDKDTWGNTTHEDYYYDE